MEDYIVDLYYNKNYTFRQIQKITKKSPRDIKAILDKADPTRSSRAKAIPSQAYKLLSEGKPLTEVAIALDIREPEVAQYYKEFLRLNQLCDFNQILEQLEGDIKYFVDLCKAAKSEKISVPEVINLLRIADGDLQAVETRYEDLNGQIRNLETCRENSQAQLESVNDTLRTARLTLRSTIEDSDKEMGKLLNLQERTAKQQNRLAKEAAEEVNREVISKASMMSLPLLPLDDGNEQERTPSLHIRTSNITWSSAVQSYYLNLQ